MTKAQADAVIRKLNPLLAGFVANPFNSQAIHDWYIALAEHCPLWALQERGYRKFFKGPKAGLVLDHAWRIMLQASEASDESFLSGNVIWNAPVIQPEGIGNQRVPAVQRPPGYGDPKIDPAYLLHVYRSTLIRRLDEVPLERSLHAQFLTLPEPSRKIPSDYDPDDPGAWSPEITDALDVVEELRRLIVDRDLADGKRARDAAKNRLGQYLRDLGVTRGGGRPSLPEAETLIPTLAKECRVWLAAERAAQSVTVSNDAVQALTTWNCPGNPHIWAEHLAFPFLTRHELDFLHSATRPHGDDVTAVCLIHYRLQRFFNFATVAEYAFSGWTKHTLSLPPRNPLLTQNNS